MEVVGKQMGQLGKMLDRYAEYGMDAILRIFLALLILLIGRLLIKLLVKLYDKATGNAKMDETVRGYIRIFLRATLYVLLIVSIVAEIGVPMSSVIAVIASCGLAIGLALQGALGNFAGGIMLLLFRPFNVGDYIQAGNEEGAVRSITLIYTTLLTVDNKVISIPNGAMMNANITNATAEDTRRVDLRFEISSDEPIEKVRTLILEVIGSLEEAFTDPAPMVQPIDIIPGGIVYSVRVWTNTKDYYEVFNALMIDIPTALRQEGIRKPAASVNICKEID